MKTFTLSLVLIFTFFLTSCGNGVETLTEQTFNGPKYCIVQYTSENTEDDLIEYARTWDLDDYTTYYFFFHKDSVNEKDYTDFKYSKKGLQKQILKDKPQYGWYIMPNDNRIYKDGNEIIEMAVSDKYN